MNQLSWELNNEHVRFRFNASFIPMFRDVNHSLLYEMSQDRLRGRLNQDRLRSLIKGPALITSRDDTSHNTECETRCETRRETGCETRRETGCETGCETRRETGDVERHREQDVVRHRERDVERHRERDRERYETRDDRHLSHLPLLIGDMYEPV